MEHGWTATKEALPPAGEKVLIITPEEYQQLAEEFIGARPVKNKEDETNGKDP